MGEVKYHSFNEFWSFYLGEHQHPLNRRLHVVGTGLLLVVALMVVVSEAYSYFALLPFIGYGFAWVGHFFVEKNRPATFTYPLWSLVADFKMFLFAVTGRLGDELKRCGVVPKEPN